MSRPEPVAEARWAAVLRHLARVARVAPGERERRIVLLLQAMQATAQRGDVLGWVVLREWFEVTIAVAREVGDDA